MTLGRGIQPQITRSPPQRPQMENDHRTEHSATEKVHFHYQSRRGRCTLWTPLFLHTTNHHGSAAKTHSSSLDTPYSYYQSPRVATNTHSLDTPHPLPISTGAPQIHTLWTPPSLYTLFQYQFPPTPQLWSLYRFRLV